MITVIVECDLRKIIDYKPKMPTFSMASDVSKQQDSMGFVSWYTI